MLSPALGPPVGKIVYPNLLPNPNITGATVGVIGSGGVLPTGWATIQNGTNLTVEVISIGTSALGTGQIEIKTSGTPAATATFQLCLTPTTSAGWIPMHPGGASLSCWVARSAGANTNFTFSDISCDADTAASGYISTPLNTGTFSALTSTLTKKTNSALMPATTAFGFPQLNLGCTSGAAVNSTWIITAVQIEQASAPSSFGAAFRMPTVRPPGGLLADQPIVPVLARDISPPPPPPVEIPWVPWMIEPDILFSRTEVVAY